MVDDGNAELERLSLVRAARQRLESLGRAGLDEFQRPLRESRRSNGRFLKANRPRDRGSAVQMQAPSGVPERRATASTPHAPAGFAAKIPAAGGGATFTVASHAAARRPADHARGALALRHARLRDRPGAGLRPAGPCSRPWQPRWPSAGNALTWQTPAPRPFSAPVHRTPA